MAVIWLTICQYGTNFKKDKTKQSIEEAIYCVVLHDRLEEVHID